jgi:hypothetical protein
MLSRLYADETPKPNQWKSKPWDQAFAKLCLLTDRYVAAERVLSHRYVVEFHLVQSNEGKAIRRNFRPVEQAKEASGKPINCCGNQRAGISLRVGLVVYDNQAPVLFFNPNWHRHPLLASSIINAIP